MEEQPFELENLAELVEKNRSGSDGERALQALEDQVHVLKTRIPNNPFAAVRADIFPATHELVLSAVRLAKDFRASGDLKSEEKALRLRSNAVCMTYGHQRHQVGPAMIEWAECHQRMGNVSTVEQIYQAVINDFTELIEQGGTNEATRIGLESLRTALEMSQEPDWDLWAKVQEALGKCETGDS